MPVKGSIAKKLETNHNELQSKIEGLDYVDVSSGFISDIKESAQEYQNLDQRIQALIENEGDQKEKLEEQGIKTQKVQPTPKEKLILSSSVNIKLL